MHDVVSEPDGASVAAAPAAELLAAPALTTRPALAPTVSVVICAYTEERWGRLVAAVESARRQTLPPLEVLVVVDHNSRLLARVRRELGGTKALANSEAAGLSGARNSGVAAASGDVVAFLDDDAAAHPDWIARLLPHYADSTVLGVGGTIETDWVEGRPPGFPPELDWIVGCTYRGVPDSVAPVRNLIGANMSVRRDVLETVGGFRCGIGRTGAVPVGCEETELCIRARRDVGGEFVFEPAARVSHAVPPDRATWRYFRSRCFSEGVSKAQVASAAGSRDALATERAYTLRTLPAGVLRGLGDAIRGDVSGAVRAAAIIAGLLVTATGYGVGVLRQARA
jgi:GT2 family glycosyltransferase